MSLPSCSRPPKAWLGAEHVATRIAEVLAQPLHVSGVRNGITTSIGIAAAGEFASEESLLKEADIAMYAAKAAGKGRYAPGSGPR